MSKLIIRTYDDVEKLVNSIGYDLYDIEEEALNKDHIYRVIISKENESISIDDCVLVTEQLNTYLDEIADFFPEAYMLEVTSPGLERTLKKEAHFLKAIEHRVLIKFYKKNPLVNVKEYEGVLKQYSDEVIEVDEYQFPKEEIASVKIVYEKKEKND